MPVFETFAARKRAAEQAGIADVYTYDVLPAFLRRQLTLLFTACIGKGVPDRYSERIPNNNDAWKYIADVLAREISSFNPSSGEVKDFDNCINYLSNATDIDGVLSLVELCSKYIATYCKVLSEDQRMELSISQEASDGLKELNTRFRQSSVGYQFEKGEIIRVDSEFIHAEVVKNALALLQQPIFQDANSEFRTAHEHYRAGNIRDCNTAALRSMESTLKAICAARKWPYDAGATVDKLIAIVRQHGLFPDYLEGSFNQLIGTMKSGLPKVRDRQGGHAAGPEDRPVPAYIGGYALHLAAANIVLLAKAYEALPPA